MQVLTPNNLVVLLCFVSISNAQISKLLNNRQQYVNDSKLLEAKRKLTETRIKELVQNIGTNLLPKAMGNFYSLNLSSSCITDVLRLATGIRKMKTWAFKFLDASSKSIDGLLDLSIASYGNFDECTNIQVFDQRRGKYKKKLLFRGKYCKVFISPYFLKNVEHTRTHDLIRKVKNFDDEAMITDYMSNLEQLWKYAHLTTAICVPSGCTEDDVNKALAAVDNYTGLSFRAPTCDVKTEAEFTPLIIAVITLFSFLGLLVVLGTVLDIYILNRKKPFKSSAIRILTSFSFPSNFKKIMDTSNATSSVTCLHGIRSLTMLLVIYTHTVLRFLLSMHKAAKAPGILEDFAFQFLINSTVGVDSFFFITGFLVCYSLTKWVRINKKPFHIGCYLFLRIWRILPVYSLYIASVFLYRLLGSGPEFRQHVVNIVDYSCRKNWWANMLFINNYYDSDNKCLDHTWYLSVDMQLHVAAILLLVPLMRWPKLGITLTTLCILASMMASSVLTFQLEMLPMFGFPKFVDRLYDAAILYYQTPYVHVGPYCVGLLCGYLLALHPKLRIPKVIQIFGWCASATAFVCFLYGPYKWVLGVEPTYLETLLFSSCYRVGWAMALGWVLVCCYTGRGGVVNYILSWKFWIPMGRISFLTYLVHLSVIIIHTSTLRSAITFDHQSMTWWYAGDVVISMLFALVASVCIEAPFISIGKILFTESSKPIGNDASQDKQVVHNEVSSKNGEILFTDQGTDVHKQEDLNNSVFTVKL